MVSWTRPKHGRWLGVVTLLICVVGMTGAAQAAPSARGGPPQPKFGQEAAADRSATLREIAARPRALKPARPLPEERGPVMVDRGHAPDAALAADPAVAAQIAGPLQTFEGLSNQDNFNILGFRVNPPDPVGDVGPNHYVEMTNLTFGVYSKTGTLLVGPLALGSLWDGFPITDCADSAGDPIVLYDQLDDRWLLSQFTSAGPEYWNCVAISVTGDPTGAYNRYAFSSGPNFPDYPKYGVWNNSYILTTREFGPTTEYAIGVYALERNKLVNGETKVGVVSFLLDDRFVPIAQIGDGLLPPDIDGTRRPRDGAPAPIVGTQDEGASYGATSDALNVYELAVQWRSRPTASLKLATQLQVAAFDSIFPCAPTSRDCLPQPGITNPNQYLDILSYRQRPTYRLAYRNFGTYEALVTNQSVEARPGIAGVRWYELRRTAGAYSVYQQGTYAPNDGVHRWMGSAAMDRVGNIGVGYSVVNGVDVYPGIRYTGRLRSDPLGTLPLGEGTIINGSGVQTTTNSRWGDYTSLNIDPTDDCTFWYVNEYYTAAGQASSPAGWQTRVGSFRLPGC